MDFQSPSSSTTAGDKGENSASNKQAACLNCRRSKTRCLRDAGVLQCKKCAQSGSECIVPEYRVGRKKGIKNKRDGLEKAVYRIEQAIKKHKTNGSHSINDQMNQLQGLLSSAQQLLPETQSEEQDEYQRDDSSSSPQQNLTANEGGNDGFAVQDAENPLQLLARASDLSGSANAISLPITRPLNKGDKALRSFFGPFRPSLDNEPDIDPIEMGLVTVEETSALFSYFHDNLSHTRWGLDPILHTPQFVRQQSAFLFTSILAASSLFIPTAGAISKRLNTHVKCLARKIFASGNRSPEIVLAFMINIPWMAPGKHWSDDETCSYMSMALTIALDSSLDKLIVPSPSELQGSARKGRSQSECITARKALDMDGFPDVDPLSDFGRRLLRRRERIWLALFVLDRGVCLARGRSFIVPVTPLIETCDEWHRCSIADIWDNSIVSSTVLRRDLVTLISEVKKACTHKPNKHLDAAALVENLRQKINHFFTTWYTHWSPPHTPTPPYVSILVLHGRLTLHTSLINHSPLPLLKTFFHTATLTSSLSVLRAAVRGESALTSLPNNTCIMITFAACIALTLSGADLAPSTRFLIEESAGVLERIGTVTSHRNGTSYLYGRHLRGVVAATTLKRPSTPTCNRMTDPPLYFQPGLAAGVGGVGREGGCNSAGVGGAQRAPEVLRFSDMSEDQIQEVVLGAGEEEGGAGDVWGADGGSGIAVSGLNWLDWFNVDVGGGLS
ncbi:hypothetical protein GLAREA_04965 [Glarea lozoyensis ATCC 20868]|uniref:Zn(2)-C6 fungal-type domain-containing protein n=1 Tax=Glarea lozoyensis (strain ATCC 20868 / MF5171) TaxID=1116229 RepID=S3CSX6_GLAL2|nr:uncharacterized protein GLAREA_04965 [Glarea lozoyensis ATCC 20868]EPE28174.1 hypothetical protein GLAREA_04965 [Glarea lozoyensis ATCC 20868]